MEVLVLGDIILFFKRKLKRFFCIHNYKPHVVGIEERIKGTESLIAELKKSSTDKTSLINDVITMNEGRVAAFKEILKWL